MGGALLDRDSIMLVPTGRARVLIREYHGSTCSITSIGHTPTSTSTSTSSSTRTSYTRTSSRRTTTSAGSVFQKKL